MITPTVAAAETTQEMSDDTIPTGAYVILNKQTSTVIHISKADVATATGSVAILNYKRDELNHRDQQIWWVERLPEDGINGNTTGEGVVYSITNTASGLSIDVDGASTKKGANVFAYPGHGGYNQRWRLLNGETLNEGERSIVGVASGLALGFKDPKPESGTALNLCELIPKHPRQTWEFIKPVVAIPSGWVHIINVGSGDILNQTYLSSPPELISPPELRQDGLSSRHRETWGTQWTIILPNTHQLKGCDSSGTWIIKNRLTGGRIRHTYHQYSTEHQISVTAVMPQCYTKVWSIERWVIELVDDNVWKIRSQTDSCYLQQTDVCIGKGKEIACVSKEFKRSETSKLWSFRKVTDH